jgi:hypothetical protein
VVRYLSNDLRILITGKLNESATEKLIRGQLDSIQKKFNLEIGISDKQIKDIANQVNELKSKLGSTKTNIVDDKDASVAKEIFTSIDKAVEKYKQLGQVNLTKTLNPVTKEVEKFQLAISKADGTVEKLNFEMAKMNNIQGLDNGFILKSQKVIDNTADISEKQFQQIHKLQQEIAMQQRKNYEEWWKSTLKQKDLEVKTREQVLQEEQKIRTAIDVRDKKEKELIDKLEHQLNIYKQQAQINANNLSRRYKGKFDDTELNGWLNSVNKLNTSTPELNRNMDQLGVQFKKISSEVRTSQSHAISLGEALSTAFQKFPVWMLTATIFYAPLRALQDMTAQIIEVDTAMTNFRRVTDMSDENLTDFLNESIVLSDELSNRLADTLKIAEEFARMGFAEGELLDITKTAQVLQNISDLDAKQSVDTLTSAMLNYNIAATESLKISDALNEVDNNFAISTKDLADGLRKSASTAKTFGVEFETLLGYISAIGSTTRETGAIIGRMLPM